MCNLPDFEKAVQHCLYCVVSSNIFSFMISLSARQERVRVRIPLAASKSESNRALILRALSQEPFELENLASARDTQTLISLLGSDADMLDVKDAGTTMRFLTAFLCVQERDQIITGTPRMCNRPIGILVEALRELGAGISYWKREGYPPLHIASKGKKMHGGHLAIKGNVSSQFISALLMIGPILPGGLELELVGKINSRPYLEMTLSLMEHLGVVCEWQGNTIIVPEKAYEPNPIVIESDWSAASYWYTIVAFSEDAEIFLTGLRKDSRQGDSRIANIMRDFGVKSKFTSEGVLLSKYKRKPSKKTIDIDFSATPDLAQTVAVVSGGLGIPVRMTGLETLRIKETDRIEALQIELIKFGIAMQEEESETFVISGTFSPSNRPVATYEDHRMAMAFAPFALLQPSLEIADPEVVEKSYPEFWDHLGLASIDRQEF